MARGGRTAEDDETWRPSKEDAIAEYDDEILDEEMAEEEPMVEKHTSPRASPGVSRKKASHRTKRQDDETWKPTDEDLEDEELEVQEMVNHQLMAEDSASEAKPKKKHASPKASKTSSPRKKPVGRPKHQDDDVWKPEGEDVENEEPEDEQSAYEDSAEDEPSSMRKRTPPRKAKKRPAASSAGSPELHKTTKSTLASPKHRLTTASNRKAPDYIVRGTNDQAPFTFTAYRGEGMVMLAMNWKNGTPPDDFVGFVIEYTEPQSSKCKSSPHNSSPSIAASTPKYPPPGQPYNGEHWTDNEQYKGWPIPNYCTFPGEAAHTGPDAHSSRLSPIQRFRWIHFPFNIESAGHFHYRITPAFMTGESGAEHTLSYGESQDVKIELIADTYPGKMNVAFTRGFVSSKAFVKKYGTDGGVGSILPAKASEGLDFKPEDPEIEEKALSWMGFEARQVILTTLDAAIEDKTAEVRVLAYDFNNPEIVLRLQKLGKRVKVIIDDSDSHAAADDAETKAAAMLEKTAGKNNVQRQHMGGLQHNKVLVVDGAKTKIAIGGSTNFSWRGLYVQNNNLVALQGQQPVDVFKAAFDNYWEHPNDTDGFYKTESAGWNDLGLGIDAQVTFSPHSSKAGALDGIAADIKSTESSLFYSLAFLYETPGVIREAIEKKVRSKFKCSHILPFPLLYFPGTT